MSVHQQAIGAVLDNYADVIEGGNAWRGGGTAYRGIPGTQSSDPELRSGALEARVADAGGSTTTTVAKSTVPAWSSDRWAKERGPGYFLVALTGTSAGAARRITGWDAATVTFTHDALPAALSENNTFSIRQGFRRIPNGIDINAAYANTPEGFDRYFHLSAGSGREQPWLGSGNKTFEATMEVRLRLLKYDREHDVIASAMENLARFRSVLPMSGGYGNPDHREATYTRALISLDADPAVETNDAAKVVVVDRYRLLYRINTEFR